MTIEANGKWDYKNIPALTGGIKSSDDMDKLDDSELITAYNVAIRKDALISDTGYTKFLGTVRGNPRLTYQFWLTDGTDELLNITDATIYRLKSNEWQYCPDNSAYTSLTAAAAAGATSVSVTSITGFTNGSYMGLILDDGTEHKTTVNGVPSGSTIVFTDPIPTGKSAIIGAQIYQSVVLNGNVDIQPSCVTLPVNNWFLFTNGVDYLKYYDGLTVQNLAGLPSGGATVCRMVTIYKNSIIIGFTTEGGYNYPQRVRWCATGDYTNWSTGNAGYADLVDSEDWIVGPSFIGPYMLIYKERSIVRFEYVGSATELFTWDTKIIGEGANSHDAILDVGGYNIVFGNSNIYEYHGGTDIKPIGDKVYDLIFSNIGILDPNYRQKAFGLYVEELDECWFFFARNGETVPQDLLRLNMYSQAFTMRRFQIPLTGFGLYQKTTSKTWLDLTGDWTTQDWLWMSRTLEANSPTTLLCSSSLQLYEYDYVYPYDDTLTITSIVETKDFSNPYFDLRFDRFDIEFIGQSVDFMYSVDRGVTWTLIDTISAVEMTKVSIHYQFVTDIVRFKLTTSNPAFKLINFGFSFRQENPSFN